MHIRLDDPEAAAALRRHGWYRQAERWVSPHATLWLPVAMTFGLDALRRDVGLRLVRRRRQRLTYESASDWQAGLEDAEGLMEALDELARASWPELAAAS